MEYIAFGRFIVSLAFVLGLILLISWIVRKMGWDKKWQGMGPREGRLQVIDTLMLDTRHKVVLLRCDENEHMIVLGPQGAVALGQTAATSDTGTTATHKKGERSA